MILLYAEYGLLCILCAYRKGGKGSKSGAGSRGGGSASGADGVRRGLDMGHTDQGTDVSSGPFLSEREEKYVLDHLVLTEQVGTYPAGKPCVVRSICLLRCCDFVLMCSPVLLGGW